MGFIVAMSRCSVLSCCECGVVRSRGESRKGVGVKLRGAGLGL